MPTCVSANDYFMKRWERVYNELQYKSERMGYDAPERIGSANSQIYEYSWRGTPVLIIAFRDLAQRPDYALPNRLWAEGLDLVLKHYDRRESEGGTLPQAAAIVIDNLRDAYIVVMITELLELYRSRRALDASDGRRHFTFVVRREDSDYFLVMPDSSCEMPLTTVNKIDNLLLLLKSARPV
jgi:hypothetical protein